jgi:hypothetical protein
MNAEKLLVEAAKERWKTEIEKAINKVKLGMIPRKPRTKLDEWWRRRYYIETARLRKYAEQGNESGKKRRRFRTAFSHREEQTIGGELK